MNCNNSIAKEFTKNYSPLITKLVLGDRLTTEERADALSAMVFVLIAVNNLEEESVINTLIQETDKKSSELLYKIINQLSDEHLKN